MKTPFWFNRELSLIDDSYFAIYNPIVKRWQIRKWNTIFPWCYRWEYMSENIITVYKENFDLSSGLIDSGYQDLDMRPIKAIKVSNYNKNRIKEFVARIDENNERIYRKGLSGAEEIGRDVARNIYKFYREPSVYLDGKCLTWRK